MIVRIGLFNGLGERGGRENQQCTDQGATHSCLDCKKRIIALWHNCCNQAITPTMMFRDQNRAGGPAYPISTNLEGAPSKLRLGGDFRWSLKDSQIGILQTFSRGRSLQRPHPNVAKNATLGWGTRRFMILAEVRHRPVRLRPNGKASAKLILVAARPESEYWKLAVPGSHAPFDLAQAGSPRLDFRNNSSNATGGPFLFRLPLYF